MYNLLDPHDCCQGGYHLFFTSMQKKLITVHLKMQKLLGVHENYTVGIHTHQIRREKTFKM